MILITGGAGFIGSHVNKVLSGEGYETLILDNLSKGNDFAVKWGKFVKGDLSDLVMLRKIFSENMIDLVVHCAAAIEVGESVKDPLKYYQTNLANTLTLLKVMQEFSVKKIMFSSTAAIFGEPKYLPVDEKHPQQPTNPYGFSKLIVEQVFRDCHHAWGLDFVVFRYFNACGASQDSDIGQSYNPPTHLIGILMEVAGGKRDKIMVNGTDFPTKDGTCIRDYIHVMDLAKAHLLGYKYLMAGGKSDFFNLGNGKGFSVREVIGACKKVTKIDFKVEEGPRRPGDSSILVADSSKARSILGWKSDYPELETIIDSAWNWYKKENQL